MESIEYLDLDQQQKQRLPTTISNQISFINFINAIKSPATKKKYSYLLQEYFKYLQFDISNLDLLLSRNSKTIDNEIIKYIIDLKKNKGLAYSSLNTKLAAIFLFYTMNDIVLNRKKIARYLGEHIKTVKDRGYTIDEIKKIVDCCSLKYNIVVTMMASNGCRIGAIPNLVLKNLKYHDKYQLYQITFYENSKDEYYSFCTPECSNYIKEYLSFRERSGEKLNQNSPLIRNEFQQDDSLHIENPKFLTLDSYHKYLSLVLVKVGIRTNHLPTLSIKKKKQRKEIPQNHGFRKFTMTTMSDANINVEKREMLLGHSIGLGDSYYRPTEQKMLQEYLKVVNDLTINEANRLKKENDELKENIDYNKFKIEKEMNKLKEENIILSQRLIKIDEYIKCSNDSSQKLDEKLDLILEERHLTKEYESIPDDQKRKKDIVHKKILETRKRRIQVENDYNNLIREHILKQQAADINDDIQYII